MHPFFCAHDGLQLGAVRKQAPGATWRHTFNPSLIKTHATEFFFINLFLSTHNHHALFPHLSSFFSFSRVRSLSREITTSYFCSSEQTSQSARECARNPLRHPASRARASFLSSPYWCRNPKTKTRSGVVGWNTAPHRIAAPAPRARPPVATTFSRSSHFPEQPAGPLSLEQRREHGTGGGQWRLGPREEIGRGGAGGCVSS
jgi:hypothetical protein